MNESGNYSGRICTGHRRFSTISTPTYVKHRKPTTEQADNTHVFEANRLGICLAY